MGDQSPLAPAPTLFHLHAGLRNLRQAWPDRWPGMPLVFDRSWQQLGFSRPRKGSRADRLLALGRAISEQSEEKGAARFSLGEEPSYHNRLHTSDTLVCLTFLLKASRHLTVP